MTSIYTLKQENPELKHAWQQRMIAWRQEPVIVRLPKPTRIDRARALGYKAKKGYFVVRVKVPRGGRMREKFHGGRMTSKMRRMKVLDMNYQTVAEQRANKPYANAEVLNSYYLAQDGRHYWYEVILVDRTLVSNYPSMGWLENSRGRVNRGLTISGRKSRSLLGKGKGYEKMRPSKRANKWRRLLRAHS
ncbi:MAG TPA: 50S ribosomal protein L15e [Candidatus Nanoarchaeia archaeon]|nr:50S ribosomal protein L15e [Candidatus Nanoarchaeia archaeon]